MGIHFGRILKKTVEVEWFQVSHCECDGIGGLTRLLREHGAKIPKLPETKHPCRGIFSPLWKLFRNRDKGGDCAVRSDWLPTNPLKSHTTEDIKWHLFTKEETQAIISKCRELQVTVNSYLLQCLDQTIRPEILSPQKKITWMVPVNLRGDIHYNDDTQNHVSCVEVRISKNDTAQSIHRQILQRLERGEQRANYLLLTIGGILSHQAKVNFLIKDRLKPTGNIGAFSNLGVWNIEEETPEEGWIFCPPIVTGQLLGAGCVTFNGRLGIATQGNSDTSSASQRMDRWIENIR
jgi:hypothetical protein